jgi:hypothetical protein
MQALYQASALFTGLLQAQAEALLAFCALSERVGCLLQGHRTKAWGTSGPPLKGYS